MENLRQISITILLPSELPSEQRNELISALELVGEIQVPEDRAIPNWDTIILLLKAISAASSAAGSLLKLASELKKWRRSLRSKKIKVKGELRHPSAKPLQLEMATDEEVEQWLRRL